MIDTLRLLADGINYIFIIFTYISELLLPSYHLHEFSTPHQLYIKAPVVVAVGAIIEQIVLFNDNMVAAVLHELQSLMITNFLSI